MLGQIGITQWDFHTPVSRFGAYFENNSRFDDVVVDFYDSNYNLIGTRTATSAIDSQTWTWNGWESDIPIARIVTTGNDTDFWGGFVWFEDAELSFAAIPEPSGLIVIAAMGFAVVNTRKRRLRSTRV